MTEAAMGADPFLAFVNPEYAADINIGKGWKPKVGQPLPQVPGVFIGKRFGAGALAMNTIFDLVDERGKTVGQALKVCKQTIAARRSLAHEWKIFNNLGLLGEEHPAVRSHFLQAHRVLKLDNDNIGGIVMEKANGTNVVKTLKREGFCNVRYVIALLRDMLVALDVAQRVLGFAHYDLKLDNIMEHWSCAGNPEEAKRRVLLDAVPQFKLFDFGTAVIYPDPFSVKDVPDARHLTQTEDQRPEAAEQLKRERRYGNSGKPGVVTHSADESQFEYSEPYCFVRIYHMYWHRSGDVFRVLKALCRLLDDTTWPSEDIELVSLLLTVLEHCTNSKRLRAHFVPRAQLLRRLQLQEQHHSQQQQQQGAAGQQVQQKPQVQQQTVKAAAPAPAGASASPAAVTSSSSAAVSRLVAGTDLQQQQQQQQQSSIQSMVRPVVLQELTVKTPGSAFSSPAAAAAAAPAAAGPASPGQRPMGRRSADLLRCTPSGNSVSGVAFTRLAPTTSTPASPTRATAPMQPLDAQQQQHAPDAASKAHSRRDAGLGSSAAALAASSDEFSAEGCALDPAAQVVAEQPAAPVAAQSVLGSRKALRGVTAQQLLAEPVIQALLRKLE
uniref:Protein kinase domain-containing protein n=1 Tax=Tetradesmus obliquus TaxID=3088 RepID=A0A383VYL6_TETOB|eukprot:jgi/Sobl393_1/13165/SZX69854.1